ncbi:hypothetical protein CANARDRAFT_6040 [[Candida] arabinofermentans NRRL YB-2248]|uniref:Protein YOP1 n=1 Tax=[Candida] arabinofermentans NRRL YB-2248 TaxID=983967 RepID=A0A1E4T6W8_9ASCO|nr:hypothetical protein CANARDRAFT_6040 [[Candida] arabinofermentans NRRL YB-2248]
MFGTFFKVIGFSITFLHPLNETYKVLITLTATSSQGTTSTTAQGLLSAVGNQYLPPQLQLQSFQQSGDPKVLENSRKWLIYWVMLSICLVIKSNKVIKLLLGILPFSSIISLYLQAWLVFPIVDLKSQTGATTCKVSGCEMLYTYYLSDLLSKLNNYVGKFNFDEIVKVLVSLYNGLIDDYLRGASFLKVSGFESKQQNQFQGQSIFGAAKELINKAGYFENSSSSNKVERGNNSWKPSTSMKDYIPLTLIIALASPFQTLTLSDVQSITGIKNSSTNSNAEATAEGFDFVSKDEFDANNNGGGLPIPKLRDQRSSSTIRSDVGNSTGVNLGAQPPNSRKSSWNFGWKSRNSSVSGNHPDGSSGSTTL